MDSSSRTALAVPTQVWTLDAVHLDDDSINGRRGLNRARGRRQIEADTDAEAINAWLSRFVESPNTFASSRKEAERLYLWCLRELGKPLSSLVHEDMQDYKRFLAAPPSNWTLQRTDESRTPQKVPRNHPDWRPFAGPLASSSIRQAIAVLNSMMSWLVDANYLEANPLFLGKKRGSAPARRPTRMLESDLWDAVRTSILAMPRESEKERAVYARSRWLMSLFFIGGLRISEVAFNRMGDFYMELDPSSAERQYWLDVTGKGGKQRRVPATTELMVELMTYRRSLELADLPLPQEEAPLVFPLLWVRSNHPGNGWPKQLTRTALHDVVKSVFDLAATQWESSDPRAIRLREASSHWLRHTAASRMANTMNLNHVRDTLGHANISTTNIYVHGEDAARHRETSAKHRLGW